MAPVFGPPPAADTAQLIIVMAGDYRSKKEIAHILVPAVGRKIIDLGGNLEKGRCIADMLRCTCNLFHDASQHLHSSSLAILSSSALLRFWQRL